MTRYLWPLAIAAIAVAILVDVVASGWPALVAAIVATLVASAAAIAEPRPHDRRPW